ncbi:hypothetical protein BC629DRAFT_1594646 [Irpex lacteus]|nr:hypothetical protein BC629DRAFT_1594646 [Irpex lacteus]
MFVVLFALVLVLTFSHRSSCVLDKDAAVALEWDLGLNEDTRKKKRSCAVTLSPSSSPLPSYSLSSIRSLTPQKRTHRGVAPPENSENDGGRLKLIIM